MCVSVQCDGRAGEDSASATELSHNYGQARQGQARQGKAGSVDVDVSCDLFRISISISISVDENENENEKDTLPYLLFDVNIMYTSKEKGAGRGCLRR